MPGIEGHLAVVIGGAKGIGRGVVELLQSRGASVLAVDYDEAALAWTKERAGIEPAVMDLRDPQVGRALEVALQGRVPEILCVAAGIYPNHPFDSMTDENWEEVMTTNLVGPVRILKKIVPAMAKKGYGRIVMISSITGPMVGNPGLVHYSASKGGMEGVMRGIALEYAQQGITVNAIRPGNILTDGVLAVSQQSDIDFMSKGIPVRRLGTCEEVAELVHYFSLPNASFVTGQTLVIDGGQTIQEYQEGLLQ